MLLQSLDRLLRRALQWWCVLLSWRKKLWVFAVVRWFSHLALDALAAVVCGCARHYDFVEERWGEVVFFLNWIWNQVENEAVDVAVALNWRLIEGCFALLCCADDVLNCAEEIFHLRTSFYLSSNILRHQGPRFLISSSWSQIQVRLRRYDLQARSSFDMSKHFWATGRGC